MRLALHLGRREEDVTRAELGLFAVANEARASFDDEIELFLPVGGLVVRNDEEAAG